MRKWCEDCFIASVSQSLERVYEIYYGLILFTKLEKL